MGRGLTGDYLKGTVLNKIHNLKIEPTYGTQSALCERKQSLRKTRCSSSEAHLRSSLQVYADNKAYIDQHMKEHAEGKHTFTVALNKFADLTTEEWSRLYKGLKMGSTTPHKTYKPSGKTAPGSMDWRQYGVVTGVKDQGQCGSCWAFSAIGSLEGAWAQAGNSLVSLSEQQVTDCSWAYGNQGCNGGWMDQAFE